MEQEPGFRELARGALEWIICAKKPLTIVTLQHALAVEENATKLSDDNFTDISLIISVCGGLVTVNEQTNIIRLVHHTTQEYFEQARETWFPEAQFNITRACITYLSFADFNSDDCYSLLRRQVKQLRRYPFYKYAICHWGHHARKSSRSDRLVQEFLECPIKVVSASQVLRFAQDSIIFYQQWTLSFSNGLLLAAKFGLHRMVALLQHLDASARDSRGREPLAIAAAAGHAEFVETLLTTGRVSVDSRDDGGRTALSWAARNGYEKIVGLLLATSHIDVNFKDDYGRTSLCYAAQNGHEMIVRLLLETGQVDVDSKDIYGRTPLCLAAKGGHEMIVRLLLATGQVDVDSKDNDGLTPLSWATRYGHEMIVGLLLATRQVDADSSDYTGQTPLSWAARFGHEMVVRLLLDTGQVDVNSKNNDGQTPLSWASEGGHGPSNGGHEKTVRLLLRSGADVNWDDKDGRTPLSWASGASEHEDEAVVKLLLESGADVNWKDTDGQTALSRASGRGHEETVRLLLGNGAE